jgi:hypothetical protein
LHSSSLKEKVSKKKTVIVATLFTLASGYYERQHREESKQLSSLDRLMMALLPWLIYRNTGKVRRVRLLHLAPSSAPWHLPRDTQYEKKP